MGIRGLLQIIALILLLEYDKSLAGLRYCWFLPEGLMISETALKKKGIVAIPFFVLLQLQRIRPLWCLLQSSPPCLQPEYCCHPTGCR